MVPPVLQTSLAHMLSVHNPPRHHLYIQPTTFRRYKYEMPVRILAERPLEQLEATLRERVPLADGHLEGDAVLFSCVDRRSQEDLFGALVQAKGGRARTFLSERHRVRVMAMKRSSI